MIVELFKVEKLTDDNKFATIDQINVRLLLNLPIEGIDNTVTVDNRDLPSWTYISEGKNATRLAWLITLSKWRYIREYLKKYNNEIIDNNGGSTCGLCLYFSCGNSCPISNHTGLDDCQDTPYGDFATTLGSDIALKYAREELKFLFKVYKQWKKDNPKGDIG